MAPERSSPDPGRPRQLSVLRHAKSGQREAGRRDFERPLDSRGEREAPATGRRLAMCADPPTFVIASDARRAEQTTRSVLDAFSAPPALAWEHELYLASASTVLEFVSALDASHRHVLIVGHNPGLTEFANRFADADLGNLPTCGLVRMRLWVPEWSDAGWQCASVEHIDTPQTAVD